MAKGTPFATDLGEKSHDAARGRVPQSAPFDLRQRSLRLGQPEGHLHGPVHRDGRGQLGAGLFPLTGCGIQRAGNVLV